MLVSFNMKINYNIRKVIVDYLSDKYNIWRWHTIEDISTNTHIPKDTIYYYLDSILNSPGGKEILEEQKNPPQPNMYKALQ